MGVQIEDHNVFPPLPGYDVLRRIGRGGVGDVALARQQATGRLVAVKGLQLDDRPDDHQALARLHREADLMALVDHPNILKILDFLTVDGRPFLVSEYIEGGDLRRRMTPDAPMPLRDVRSLVRPIADALTCLHQQGILHRDIKPENILLRDDATPLLADFGISVLSSGLGRLTNTAHAVGTLGYIAPEQQFRLKVDERADQYSFACLIYEMLTGRPPLGVFKPASRHNADVGESVDRVLERALQEDPADRFASVADLIDALEAAFEKNPAPSKGLSRRTLVGSLLVIGLLTVGVAARYLRPSQPAPAKGPAVKNAPAPAVEELPREHVNRLGMNMILLNPGRYQMGTNRTFPHSRESKETPAHDVRVERPFYLADREVTVGQFRRFVEETGYRTEAEKNGKGGRVFDAKTKAPEYCAGTRWDAPGFTAPIGVDQPVVQVTWDDAVAFCNWLSQRERTTYRLPTEVEWEYACRAGTSTRWSFGDDPVDLRHYAWYSDNAEGRPQAVGFHPGNGWGFFDMHGNAWEWCSNLFEDSEGGPVLENTSPDTIRPLRGGAWDWSADQTRSTYRFGRPANLPFYTFGFRVCRPVDLP